MTLKCRLGGKTDNYRDGQVHPAETSSWRIFLRSTCLERERPSGLVRVERGGSLGLSGLEKQVMQDADGWAWDSLPCEGL